MDAANVGVEVEDKRQRSERLLAKTGDRELRKVRSRAADGTAVATVQDAQALREKVRRLFRVARVTGRIACRLYRQYVSGRYRCFAWGVERGVGAGGGGGSHLHVLQAVLLVRQQQLQLS